MQVNTIREVTDCNSKNCGKLRPVMNTTGYRIPIDGKATTLSNCNQEVLDDYGINMQCFGQWTTDHCNAALDVSATDCAHSCCLNCDICRSMHKWRSRPLISDTPTYRAAMACTVAALWSEGCILGDTARNRGRFTNTVGTCCPP